MVLRAGLTKRDFVREPMPLVDALVAFVPDGTQPSAELQEQLDQRDHSRWYPEHGGHQVKMPFQGDEPPSGSFEIERGGWDHDHCDQCNASVRAGEYCWVTRDAQFSLLCDACYEELGPGGLLAAAQRLWKRLFA
jgi:hypothetical protein